MRIVIADDHAVVRSGLRAILGSCPDWEVCGEAQTGHEAIALALRFRPDLIILDLSMPGMGGLEAAAVIKKTVPGVEIIVLTCHYSKPLLNEIAKLGVLGFVLKSDAGRDLIAAVQAIQRHEPYVSRHPEVYISPRSAALYSLLSDSDSLTKRERAEVRMIADQIRQIL
jgi:DNA-binding NarL/FixJ family response regulator